MRTVSAAEMREFDRRTIAEGVKSGAELMESAGAAVADKVRSILPPGGKVLVIAGKGNNGGDGLVVARRLDECGINVELVTVCGWDDYSGDAGEMARRLPDKVRRAAGRELRGEIAAAVIVDALLGTGFQGGLRPPYREWIEMINIARAENPSIRVVAVDLPSGLNADGGEVAETAVKADFTVTFHCAKTGMVTAAGRDYCGEITVADIGIPF